MNLTLKDLKKYESGALLGWASVILDGYMEIRKISVFEKDGRRWASPPSVPYEDKDGNKKYSNIIHFENKEDKQEFSDSVCALIEEPSKDNHIQEPPDDSGIPF